MVTGGGGRYGSGGGGRGIDVEMDGNCKEETRGVSVVLQVTGTLAKLMIDPSPTSW